VPVPRGYSRAKIRCGDCGYYAQVPENLRTEAAPEEPDDMPVIAPDAAPEPRRRSREADDGEVPRPPLVPRSKPKKPIAKAIARENPNPRDLRPEFVIPDGADLGPDLLEGNQVEHDDQAIPYRVPGDGTMTCRECSFKLPLGSTFCVNCGLDFATKKKPKKRFQTIDREWEPRINLALRLQIFAGLQVLNLLIILLLRENVSVVGASIALIFQGALQAFLIGSYEKIAVYRSEKGQATLTKTWRFCFIPMKPTEIDWKRSHAMGVIHTHTLGFLEWITFFYLLLLFVVPGIVFYFLVIHPMRFQIVLCDIYGSVDEVIFRTTNEDQPDEICEVVSTATGLSYRKTM
jgi:hypothetical protein